MPKIFLAEVPCTDEYLAGLRNVFPSNDPFSIYTYLTFRKISSDLENALEAYFSSYGISTGRFTLMMLLATNPAGLMPSELAQSCGVTQATISGLLNGLEKAGLIVRETHSHDGRAYVIRLSDKGHGLLNMVKPEFMGCVDKLVEPLNLDQKKALVDVLNKFTDGIKCISELRANRS